MRQEDSLMILQYNGKKYVLITVNIKDNVFDYNLKRDYYLLAEENIDILDSGCIIDIENCRLINVVSHKEIPLLKVEFEGKGSQIPFEFSDDVIDINILKYIEKR